MFNILALNIKFYWKMLRNGKRFSKRSINSQMEIEIKKLSDEESLSRLPVEAELLELKFHEKYNLKEKIILELQECLGYFVMIETQKDIIIGALQKFNLDNKTVTIRKMDVIMPNASGKKQLILISNIQKIRKFQNDPNYDDNDSTINDNKVTIIQLTPFDMKHVLRSVHEAVYINDRTNNNYLYALESIQNQAAVGVVIEPYHFNCNCISGTIAFSTISGVFIFNINLIKSNIWTFRTIFAEERPIKIIHNYRTINNILKSRYDIALNSVFDTELANRLMTPIQIELPLREYLLYKFQLPERFLEFDNTAIHCSPYLHSISTPIRIYLAKLAILQLKAYQLILPNELPTDFIRISKEPALLTNSQ